MAALPKGQFITFWEFKAAFGETFVNGVSKAERWTQMNERAHRRIESLNFCFHIQVKMWYQLALVETRNRILLDCMTEIQVMS